jgi:protein-tyrosine phosphatase
MERRDGDAPAPLTLLFVCIANVCRSPTMEFMTAHHLQRLGIGSSWALSSAGTSAHDGDSMCATAAGALRHVPGGADFAAAHRARGLDATLVEGADLIMVATHLERPSLARLSPAARSRTFTMVEAALLAEAAVRRPRRPWQDDEPLGGLLANMHAARGSISLPERPPLGERLLRFSHAPDGLDVRDVHSGTGGSHRRTLADLRWASARFARAMAVLHEDLRRPDLR